MEAIPAVVGMLVVIAATLGAVVWGAARLVGRPLPEEWLDRKRDPWKTLLEQPFILDRRPNGHAA